MEIFSEKSIAKRDDFGQKAVFNIGDKVEIYFYTERKEKVCAEFEILEIYDRKLRVGFLDEEFKNIQEVIKIKDILEIYKIGTFLSEF